MFGFSKKKSNSSNNKSRIIRLSDRPAGRSSLPSGKKNNNHARKKGAIWKRMLVTILWMVFFGVVGYVLFFSPLLAINKIHIQGQEKLGSEEISSAIRAELSGKHFNLVQKNNLLLARKGAIREALTDGFKRIEDVEIEKEFPNKLSVSIREVDATLVFCDEARCWVLDGEGRAYVEADFSSNELGEKDLVILRSGNQKSVSREDVSVEKDLIYFITEIGKRLAIETDIRMEKEVSTPALVSGDLRFKTEEGWIMYLNKDLGIEKSVTMLRAVMDEGISGEKRGKLEYVDLRVNSKAYYKLKKEEGDAEEKAKNDRQESEE